MVWGWAYLFDLFKRPTWSKCHLFQTTLWNFSARPALRVKGAFVHAESYCNGKLWPQSCVICFDGILLIQPLQFSDR